MTTPTDHAGSDLEYSAKIDLKAPGQALLLEVVALGLDGPGVLIDVDQEASRAQGHLVLSVQGGGFTNGLEGLELFLDLALAGVRAARDETGD